MLQKGCSISIEHPFLIIFRDYKLFIESLLFGLRRQHEGYTHLH